MVPKNSRFNGLLYSTPHPKSLDLLYSTVSLEIINYQ